MYDLLLRQLTDPWMRHNQRLLILLRGLNSTHGFAEIMATLYQCCCDGSYWWL